MSALAETIAAQADLLERVLAVDVEGAVARLDGARRLWLVGTGTSQHAAELGARMLASGGRETRWASSATFARFGPVLDADDAVVVISHTARTAFARRARARSQAAGARVVSITAQGAGWPEAIETVPRERSQTYTASYTAALVVLARLGMALGSAGIAKADLAALPGRVRAAARADDAILEAPPARLLVAAGVGPGAITAREGALKVREAARIAAEGFEAEYLLHGSAVPLDGRDALVLVQPGADPDGLAAEIGEAARAEGVAVATLEEPGGLPPTLEQVPLTVRLQKLASRLADGRGEDPDTAIRGAWEADALWRAGAPEDRYLGMPTDELEG